jgi:hypothetical protein
MKTMLRAAMMVLGIGTSSADARDGQSEMTGFTSICGVPTEPVPPCTLVRPEVIAAREKDPANIGPFRLVHLS